MGRPFPAQRAQGAPPPADLTLHEREVLRRLSIDRRGLALGREIPLGLALRLAALGLIAFTAGSPQAAVLHQEECS